MKTKGMYTVRRRWRASRSAAAGIWSHGQWAKLRPSSSERSAGESQTLDNATWRCGPASPGTRSPTVQQ